VQGTNGVVQPEVDVPVVRPVVAGPLKDGQHPQAALLFVGFLTTQEGQQLWQQYRNESSLYVEGSSLATYLQGKQYALGDEAFVARELAARSATYAKTLGY